MVMVGDPDARLLRFRRRDVEPGGELFIVVKACPHAVQQEGDREVTVSHSSRRRNIVLQDVLIILRQELQHHIMPARGLQLVFLQQGGELRGRQPKKFPFVVVKYLHRIVPRLRHFGDRSLRVFYYFPSERVQLKPDPRGRGEKRVRSKSYRAGGKAGLLEEFASG